MTIDVNVRKSVLYVPVADVSGTITVDVLAEWAVGGRVRDKVREKLTEALKAHGFTGEVVIDGERTTL